MKNKILSFLDSDKALMIIITLCLTALSVIPFLIKESYHDSQRIISTFILLILSYKIINIETISKASTYILLALFFLGSISSALSTLPYWSMIELLLLMSIVIFAINFHINDYNSLLQKVVILFCFLQFIYIIRILTNYSIAIARSDLFDVDMIIDGFSNRRFYAQFISWTLPFVLAYTCINKDKNNKYFILMSILSTGLVLFSGTRAFFVGLAFSIITLYFFIPSLWKAYASILLKVLLGGIVFYTALVFIIPWCFNLDNSLLLKYNIDRDLANSSGRSEIWLITFKVFLEHPYFGIGPMMLALDGIYNGVAHPHNMILQIMSEWGILFSILFFGILFYLAITWKNLIRQDTLIRAPLALGITASISSAFMVSLVDGIIVMPVSIIYLCIIMGLGSALWKQWKPQSNPIKLNYSFKILLYIPVLSLTIITSYQWLNLEQLGTTASTPRFWQDGTLANPKHIPQLSAKLEK